MKYVLLLMFFVGSSDSGWQLANTTASDYESRTACEAAARTVWMPFKQLENAGGDRKKNGINIAAWCLDKNARTPADNERVTDVGLEPKN